VKLTIQELIKRHPLIRPTYNEMLKAFNEKFGTNFLKPNSVSYALNHLGINIQKEINKKLGLNNHDFNKYSIEVKDELLKKQCLAMALIKEGKSYEVICRELNVSSVQVKKWLRAFVEGQRIT
jgi:DNA-binding NarL/FixJ family response regulator